jgi:hypothetical protein
MASQWERTAATLIQPNGVTEVTFPGYTVSAEGTRPLEEKCGRVCCEIMQWASTFCRDNNAFIIMVRAADTYETLVST